jgi:hypothetical protein
MRLAAFKKTKKECNHALPGACPEKSFVPDRLPAISHEPYVGTVAALFHHKNPVTRRYYIRTEKVPNRDIHVIGPMVSVMPWQTQEVVHK